MNAFGSMCAGGRLHNPRKLPSTARADLTSPVLSYLQHNCATNILPPISEPRSAKPKRAARRRAVVWHPDPLGGMPHSATEELGGSGCASAASAAVPRRAIRRPSFSCSGSADEALQLDAIVRAAGVTEFWQEQRSNVNLHFPSLVYDTYTHASDVPFSTQMKANYSWVMTFAVAGVACRCGAGRLASLLGIAAPSPRGTDADGSLEAVLFYDLLANTAGCFLMGACAGASRGHTRPPVCIVHCMHCTLHGLYTALCTAWCRCLALDHPPLPSDLRRPHYRLLRLSDHLLLVEQCRGLHHAAGPAGQGSGVPAGGLLHCELRADIRRTGLESGCMAERDLARRSPLAAHTAPAARPLAQGCCPLVTQEALRRELSLWPKRGALSLLSLSVWGPRRDHGGASFPSLPSYHPCLARQGVT